MNQIDQNINKDMSNSDLIDVESLDFSDHQTWLYKVPNDSGQMVDMVDWSLSLDWPTYDDDDYQRTERELFSVIDEIIKHQVHAMPDKHKFDSRTYVKPKKRTQRPSIQNIVEVNSNPPSLSPNNSLNSSANKYLTYNKYNSPLGPILRLKTFTVDSNTDNSSTIKEYAMKRRSLVQDEDPQLEDVNMTLVSDASGRLSSDNCTLTASKPINIDLSQPAHNLHNTFNKGLTNMMNDRGSLNMYQSGESLMRMSPPSLVSSLLMESSGNFNHESLDSRKSLPSNRDSGVPTSGRDSIDPLMTSMTLSILDEKDMSTSFLSQTTYPDNDSFMDSLPPSLVSSVNSSYVVSNTSKPRSDSMDSNNIFSSATFTHLEQSEKLLSARPRCPMYNSFTKRESVIRNSESYTKARDEGCQIDSTKVLNGDKNTPKVSQSQSVNEMSETITLHYSNNKFKRDNDAEKENLNSSFVKDDTFYKEMGLKELGLQKAAEIERNSMNVTLDKQELNEIIQARQKLSLARRALPTEPERPLPNQVDTAQVKTIQLPNQTITVPKKSMENASELLSRRRVIANGYERQEETAREPPKRNATFKRSPKTNSVDTTVVYVKDEKQIIDINSATMNLIDSGERTLQQEDWGSQERAMVGSSESTDTGTFSSSSPPDSVPDTVAQRDPKSVASTPIAHLRKGSKSDLLNLHSTISPIYDMIDDKSYTLTNMPSAKSSGTYDLHNTTVINSATIVKKSSAKRDILARRVSPERKILGPSVQQKAQAARVPPTGTASYSTVPAPTGVPRRTGLPTSKLRQYSSHKELRIPIAGGSRYPYGGVEVKQQTLRCKDSADLIISLDSGRRSGRHNDVTAGTSSYPRAPAGRSMLRRNVYASNPALSPTAPAPAPVPAVRRDSYTIAVEHQNNEEKSVPRPTVPAPPALVRQGTETLRRERPQSHLVQPKDLRGATPATGVPVSMRGQHIPPPTTRPYSVAGASQLRVSRPSSVPPQKPAPGPAPSAEPQRPSTTEIRTSALPRPSRLPAPRRALRPPSVYSVAPGADMDHY